MGFGIPGDLPIKNSGSIKTQTQKKWIAYRQMVERADAEDGNSVTDIFCPSPQDVLVVGGMHFYKYPGNIVYRGMLESKIDDYVKAVTVEEKMRITTGILNNIVASGGRFLVRDKNGWWTAANEQSARTKVSNAFRDLHKSHKAHQNRKRIKCDTHKFAAIGQYDFCHK